MNTQPDNGEEIADAMPADANPQGLSPEQLAHLMHTMVHSPKLLIGNK